MKWIRLLQSCNFVPNSAINNFLGSSQISNWSTCLPAGVILLFHEASVQNFKDPVEIKFVVQKI